MKLVTRMTWWMPLAGLVGAAAALGQAEQALQYQHGREGRVARGFELTGCNLLAVNGQRSEPRCFGPLLGAYDQLFRLGAARDGASLKLQEAEDVAFGQVRVPESISEFSGVGPSGHFQRKPAKGLALLPVGEYRLEGWTIKRQDDKGVNWTVSGDGFSEMGNFTVATNKPAVLEIGEPIIAALRATDLTNAVMFSLHFRGRLNESISFQAANQQLHGPPLLLRSLNGSFRATNTFEFG